jgi:hypothetical protein
MGMDNLVELKHLQLTRSARSDALERQLKPNAITRDQLEHTLQISPGVDLTADQVCACFH